MLLSTEDIIDIEDVFNEVKMDGLVLQKSVLLSTEDSIFTEDIHYAVKWKWMAWFLLKTALQSIIKIAYCGKRVTMQLWISKSYDFTFQSSKECISFYLRTVLLSTEDHIFWEDSYYAIMDGQILWLYIQS